MVEDYKEVIAWILGATIAVVWITFAFLGAGNMLFLVVALALTILLGTVSGGFIAISKKKSDYKDVIGWLCGAGIAVSWITYALLDPGNMILLVVALALTILLGTISGGLIALSKKQAK
jgi:ABC-type Fe3+-siderophore transport system permease subunit